MHRGRVAAEAAVRERLPAEEAHALGFADAGCRGAQLGGRGGDDEDADIEWLMGPGGEEGVELAA